MPGSNARTIAAIRFESMGEPSLRVGRPSLADRPRGRTCVVRQRAKQGAVARRFDL
jgi:hypothetical protein